LLFLILEKEKKKVYLCFVSFVSFFIPPYLWSNFIISNLLPPAFRTSSCFLIPSHYILFIKLWYKLIKLSNKKCIKFSQGRGKYSSDGTGLFRESHLCKSRNEVSGNKATFSIRGAWKEIKITAECSAKGGRLPFLLKNKIQKHHYVNNQFILNNCTCFFVKKEHLPLHFHKTAIF